MEKDENMIYVKAFIQIAFEDVKKGNTVLMQKKKKSGTILEHCLKISCLKIEKGNLFLEIPCSTKKKKKDKRERVNLHTGNAVV